jgi:polyferredoxin
MYMVKNLKKQIVHATSLFLIVQISYWLAGIPYINVFPNMGFMGKALTLIVVLLGIYIIISAYEFLKEIFKKRGSE